MVRGADWQTTQRGPPEEVEKVGLVVVVVVVVWSVLLLLMWDGGKFGCW